MSLRIRYKFFFGGAIFPKIKIMIISRNNALIKRIRSLKDKKWRDREGVYVAEGIKTVKEAYLNGCEIELAIGTEKALKQADTVKVPYECVSEDVFRSISGEVSPQGLLCIIKKPRRSLSAPRGRCVFLDGVSDPSNVGAIIRTAAASGFNDVYAAGCADAYNPKSVRASMGGLFRINIYEGEREELLKFVDLPLVVADMYGENVFNAVVPDKFCLVIGNEANGISDTLKKAAYKKISIPMQNGMESLNAAVSAGILMYLIGIER